ncbi:Na+/H+ antiporter [Penicillium daleae]|uniref:Na+/H+ antiporter n=1 Tax=Penicillium daleae TaxID=63821 RepID=A0AAD6BYR6_9EURO|nr:Na+/H+ antiporter [Penicillium daleae]KAJ5439127.1 Na+/H+ antiporter [Penicillium daleae]
MTSQSALSYEEPGIRTILILSGFLLVLNLANSLLDRLVYCGLIGQIFIGVAWGMPGAQWLTLDAQEMMQQLGYLGLFLLVYEGGLSTSFKQLKANLLLSAVAAFTGVATPVALSFVLMRLVDSTSLQAFGAGAALCSTSIGTTFTILSTTGLDKSRLGTVLSGAAMMDDVAGLVMVQIISNLGSSTTGSFSAVTVVRPICVAVGFAIGIVLVCGLAVKPAVRKLRGMNSSLLRKGKKTQVAFALHMATLIGFVTGASYAGTSGLFAAYLAGACISWFDDLHISTEQSSYQGANPICEASGASQSPIEMSPRGPSSNIPSRTTPQGNGALGSDSSTSFVSEDKPRMASGQQTFTAYCKQPLQFILCPFFFASIGFAIPITQMFQGQIVWRGIVYTLLMALAKIVTGIWLLPITISPVSGLAKLKRVVAIPITWCTSSRKQEAHRQVPERNKKGKKTAHQSRVSTNTPTSQQQSGAEVRSPTLSQNPTAGKQPRSLYPASIVGLAMIARGEIGYLIASVAETGGLFAQPDKGTINGISEIYLVVVWAITLCTIIGPICVGTLVKRVRTLQAQRSQSGQPDPLGIWGLS